MKYRVPVLFFFLITFVCGSVCVCEAQTVEETAVRLRAMTQSAEVPSGPFACGVLCADQNPSRAVLFDANADWSTPEAVLWEWRADRSEDVKPEHRAWFAAMDEVKPILDRTHVLVTASGGGVALIRAADKKVLFYAFAGGNPHSAVRLPDGNIVTASSNGMFLTLFDVPKTSEAYDPERVARKKYAFDDTHGLFWDDPQQILWVLGGSELAGFRYFSKDGTPALERICAYPLAGTAALGGHDLCPVPGTPFLFVTGVGAAIFDTRTRELLPFSEITRVKSISLSPDGVLLIQKPRQSWHNESILFFNATQDVFRTCPGSQFYKARWWTDGF